MIGWHHQLMDMGLGRLRELVMDKEAQLDEGPETP